MVMHIREVKIKNGVPTIVAHHKAGGDMLRWNGEKWVMDLPLTFTVNEIMKAVLKKR